MVDLRLLLLPLFNLGPKYELGDLRGILTLSVYVPNSLLSKRHKFTQSNREDCERWFSFTPLLDGHQSDGQ